MPFAELKWWLQGCADRHPIATSLPVLDVAAIVAGLVSMSPFDWICPLLAWAPLLDANNVNHDLLLHCRDDQGAPLLGAPRSGGETRNFLRSAYADIPTAVEALRQYWMPIRHGRPSPP